jgi:AcrR family transcriptional regulator
MVRRTQAERSAGTRAALIDAAIELLVERGWAATTTVAVCERAGLTRGAVMHHYSSLSALLADALESLYGDLTRTSSPPAPTMRAGVDRIWRAVGDPRFKAVIEAWLAAGNEPELAIELGPAIARFSGAVSPHKMDRAAPFQSPDARAFILMAREAMFGLALGRASNGGRAVRHERTVLTRLRHEAAAFDARPSNERSDA